MSERAFALAGFLATLVAIYFLAGADLAITTGLVGILGMLAPGLVPGRVASSKDPQKVEVTNAPSDPVPTADAAQGEWPVDQYEAPRSRP